LHSTSLLCYVCALLLPHPSILCLFFFYSYPHHQDLHSFPTRRSSDLFPPATSSLYNHAYHELVFIIIVVFCNFQLYHIKGKSFVDRKSTRLNSSHVSISYAVFCLKKKKNKKKNYILYLQKVERIA